MPFTGASSVPPLSRKGVVLRSFFSAGSGSKKPVNSVGAAFRKREEQEVVSNAILKTEAKTTG
jgi:hypothetical protein